MYFSKLKLHGFKSFGDPSELTIDSGITGIVGPNGCGKSNVIEALRWVMGESSAKRMRGDEMDDVIFGGAAHRASRNIAEVSLTINQPDAIDQPDRRAPAGFQEEESLEITRRIERGMGSNYRINGKEVRARDVQLYFADLASGAGSSAIVSQGRIGALINAKPAERRILIEEAAAIRGLHSRRHEAQLRLKSALQNLERLADIIGAMNVQLEGLQKQARKATRYRKLGEEIRRYQARSLLSKLYAWQEAQNTASTHLNQLETELTQLEIKATEAETQYQQAMQAVPDARQKTAETGARVQALTQAQAKLEASLEEVKTRQHSVEQRLQDMVNDLNHAAAQLKDAEQALERQQKDLKQLDTHHAGSQDTLLEAKKNAQQALQLYQQAEQTYERENHAFLSAQSQSEQAKATEVNLKQKAEALKNDLASYQARLDNTSDLDKIKNEINELNEFVTAIREQWKQRQETLQQQNQRMQTAINLYRERMEAHDQILKSLNAHQRERLELLGEHRTKLVAQHDSTQQEQQIIATWQHSLTQLQETHRQQRDQLEADLNQFNQTVNQTEGKISRIVADLQETQISGKRLSEILSIPEALTPIFAALIGRGLEAGLTADQPLYWQDLSLTDHHNSVAIEGLTPLAELIEPHGLDWPQALSRLIPFCYVAQTPEIAQTCQASLPAGGLITTPEGGLWRWDGLVEHQSVQKRQQSVLILRQQLVELTKKLPDQRQQLAQCKARFEQLTQDHAKEIEHTQEQARIKRDTELATLKDTQQKAITDALQQFEAELDQQQTTFIEAEQQAKMALDQAISAREAAEAAQTEAANAFNQLDQQLSAQQTALRDKERALSEQQSQQAELRQALTRLEVEQTTNTQQLAENQAVIDALPALDALDQALQNAIKAQAEARQDSYQQENHLANLQARHRRYDQDRARLQTEIANWQSRQQMTQDQQQALIVRRTQLEQERDQLAAAPPQLSQQLTDQKQQLEAARATYQQQEQTLRLAEQQLNECDYTRREAERTLNDHKQQKIRAEATIDQLNQQQTHLQQTMQEQLGKSLEVSELTTLCGLESDQQPEDETTINTRLQRAMGEREAMGAVNLLAEQEAESLQSEIDEKQQDYDDLIQAIDRLNEGIDTLNKEGKARIRTAFKAVNDHFQQLFVRLFGGGEAELKLTENPDDPLAGGLEIIARPPGKKMQVLSLLSGGEQALTALALLFAMFLTNPAPICILDEVDAPLDDANVDRFLTLLEEIANQGDTRFLVVTHHRMTMARVDRLYGVTMAEEGISSLVSVDLGKAVTLAEDPA